MSYSMTLPLFPDNFITMFGLFKKHQAPIAVTATMPSPCPAPAPRPAPVCVPRPVAESQPSHPLPVCSGPQVMDDRGVRKALGKIIARGGEGVVHAVPGRDDLLVKLYHAQSLADGAKRGRLERKITAMCGHKGLKDHERLAWPLLPMYRAADGAWCGYVMKKRDGVSLRQLLGNPRNLGTMAPGWHRQHLVRLCMDFLDTIDSLASNKALPVDFNPSNFLVDLRTARLAFIDCDSYLFEGADGLHSAEVIMPEMAAPEVMRDLRIHVRPPSPDALRFSVGMILFYILNIGSSPYRHLNGHDPVSNLMQGKCALGHGTECRFPKGSAYLIWSHLIFDLKNLFIRCFRDGHGDPSQRPKTNEWRVALLKYNHCIVSRHKEAAILPPAPKTSARIS